MNMLSFTYQDRPIRTAGTPDAPLFVARDVCDSLDITWNGNATLAALPDTWKGVVKLSTPGGEQDFIAITEAGVYKLAFRSNKPGAEAFTNWVAGEVLPAIRKTGRYEPPAPLPDLSDPLTTAIMLQDATMLYIESETARREAFKQLADQAPAVAFARKVELSPVDISIGTFAKIIGWGPNKLHEELRRRGFMFRLGGHPVPKQQHVEAGLFTVKEVPKGDRVFPVTAITGKGQLRIARELGVSVQPPLPQLAGGQGN